MALHARHLVLARKERKREPRGWFDEREKECDDGGDEEKYSDQAHHHLPPWQGSCNRLTLAITKAAMALRRITRLPLASACAARNRSPSSKEPKDRALSRSSWNPPLPPSPAASVPSVA